MKDGTERHRRSLSPAGADRFSRRRYAIDDGFDLAGGRLTRRGVFTGFFDIIGNLRFALLDVRLDLGRVQIDAEDAMAGRAQER